MSGGAAPWWPVLASAGAISIALLGDALIYVVLPVHAEAFGVDLLWVGILLSVNRFVRVFAYGLVARIVESVGMRRMCIVAALGATVSTALYGAGEGPVVLLLARVMWGVAYAVFVMVMLGYAVADRASAGARVGWGRTIQHLGPILALLAGGWLTGVLGPHAVFLVLAAGTLVALPLAWSLPPDPAPGAAAGRHPALGRPRPLDALYFVQGLGIDGVFVVSITLILAERQGVAAAVMSGAALLAVRHVADALAAPLFGMAGDRLGAARLFGGAVLATAAGFAGIALGFTVTGALVMLVFRGALSALGPATIVQSIGLDAPVIGALARMQAWRDLGAAVGPLVTGLALGAISAQALHAGVAVLIVAGFAWWLRAGRGAPGTG